MKRLIFLFFTFLCLFISAAKAQNQSIGNPSHAPGPPVGSCLAGVIYTNITNGNVYSCNAGTWSLVTGSSTNVTHGVGAPTGLCTSGFLYTNDVNGNLYSCDAGAWVLVTTSGVIHGSGPPAGSCIAGNIYTNDTNGSIYSCSAGVWVTTTGGGANVIHGSGTPIGSCTSGFLYTDDTTGNLYSCNGSNWKLLTGGSLVANPLNNGNLTSAAPFQINVDMKFCGKNPLIDIRCYGARQAAQNSAPNIPGVTGTIGSGTSTVSVSNALFQNGDGVTIFGAGANQFLSTPSAPTVVSSLAGSLTSTGIDVNAPTSGQSTTWCYKIVGVDQGRGMSAASLPACISNGVATLGPHSLTASSSTQSNNVVTVVTSARSPEVLAPGMMIEISPSGSNPQYFEIVDTVADNTHFTYVTGEDVRVAAASNNGFSGGAIYYFNSNTLILPAPPTNEVQYVIWKSTDGGITYTRAHVTHPIADSAAASEPTYRIWDDYGSTMSGNETFPYWVSTVIPSSSTSDSLTTTVIAGGGGTNLSLAASASTSVTGGTVLLDACPGLKAAFANSVSNFGGMVYIPASGPFVINSLCDVSSNAERVSVSLAGQLTLNDTLKTGQGSWDGGLTPSNQVWPGFGPVTAQVINVLNANPGIWAVGADGVFWKNVFINGGTNGYALMFIDGGGLPTGNLENVEFFGGNTNDRVGVDLYVAGGTAGFAPSGIQFKNVLADNSAPQSGGPGGQGLEASPVITFMNMGQITIDGLYMSSRGIFMQPASEGADMTIDGKYEMQGAATPYLTVYVAGGTIGGFIHLTQPIMDTSFDCILFNSSVDDDFAPDITIDYPFAGSITACGNPFYSMKVKNVGGVTTGQSRNVGESYHGTAIDGTFATNNGKPYAVQSFKEGLEIAASYSLHTTNALGAACSASASGGGSFTGTANFDIVPVFPDNGEGSVSSKCSVSGLSSSGVALSWPAAFGAIGYDIYNNSSLLNLNSCFVPQTTLISLTLTNGGSCGPSEPSVPGSGPTGIRQAKTWTPLSIADAFQTLTNCSSNASPAVCGTSSAGSVAVPTGSTPTLVVNTTKVTANSQILVTIDESLGTKLGVTCNTTLATLVQPVVTARTAGTSFTIQINATLATNPACVSYSILN